jgi:hypothetical protein
VADHAARGHPGARQEFGAALLARTPRRVWTVPRPRHSGERHVDGTKEQPVSGTGQAPDQLRGPASRLGLRPGWVVQELGVDDDVDQALRDDVAALTGNALVDEEHDEVVDAVLLWWREDDGDLVDALVDALVSLADGGVVWLLTPKAGRDGHVEPSDIGEAAPTAGLSQTSSVAAAPDWSGTRLVAPRSGRR